MELYGFGTKEYKRLFLLLISVSGVGPKAALSILSTAPPAQLALSIITEDLKTLTMAPGIGKKIAQRIVLELRDKVAEAGAALAVLGYSQTEIQQALRGLDLSALSREEIIKAALKNMVK